MIRSMDLRHIVSEKNGVFGRKSQFSPASAYLTSALVVFSLEFRFPSWWAGLAARCPLAKNPAHALGLAGRGFGVHSVPHIY